MEKQLMAMVGLYFLVLGYMFIIRVLAMKKERVPMEGMSTPQCKTKLGEKANFPCYNFSNLFELPVLFLILTLFNLQRGVQTDLIITFGWVFVGSRYLHSLIHCTYNKVLHRFLSFIIGVVSLGGLFILSL